MNKLVFALVLVSGFAAQAVQVPLFKCAITGATEPTVNLTISVSNDESIDFLTVDLVDKDVTSTLFMQNEKGTVAQQVEAGGLMTLLLNDGFAQGADGVIRNAGIMSLSKEEDKWGGLLSMNGNMYPLECTKQ
ncbi:MAG: hypothetical protein EOP06_31695 [Proteobacteria bacterium]|nr:MAG: hypothetical protein EOP06_31695 [Pseudomonadota bacterium]